MDSTSESLLDRVGRGEESAWQLFAATYQPMIRHWCRVRGLQECDIEDVAQSVLIALHKAMEQFTYDPTKGKFRGYLKRITDREINRHVARGSKQPLAASDKLEGAAATTYWDELFHATLLNAALRTLQQSLPEKQWRVFDLVWVQSVPVQEIVESEGVSPGWIAQVKCRCIQRLKRELTFLQGEM